MEFCIVMIVERNFVIYRQLLILFYFLFRKIKIDLIKVYLIPYYSWA
jgi:hypothetical protein